MSSHKILIVDDSEVIRANLSKQLLERGYNVLACVDGWDALSKIEEFNPELIFSDVKMDLIDGFQFVSILRQNAKFALTPVVMLSSLSSVFDVAKGHLIGCNDYMTKPVQAKILDEMLGKHLGSAHEE